MNRRELLGAFGAIAGFGCCGPAAAQRQYVDGCTLSASAGLSFGGQVTLLQSSGIPIIDQSIGGEVSILNAVFRIAPSFAFFDDSDGPNAFATSAQVAGPSPIGSVCFGVNLLRAEMGEVWWGAAIAGIGGHEWAHIAQAAMGIGGPTWRRELHADFMAGWYLGNKQSAGTHIEIEGLGGSLFRRGDFDFNNRDHHGTPEQRVSAMISGYQLAVRDRVLDVPTAFSHGRQMFGI